MANIDILQKNKKKRKFAWILNSLFIGLWRKAKMIKEKHSQFENAIPINKIVPMVKLCKYLNIRYMANVAQGLQYIVELIKSIISPSQTYKIVD